MTDVFADIAAERQRQIKAEGWTPDYDDGHTDGSLAKAAACYAVGIREVQWLHADGRARGEEWGREWRNCWPQDWRWQWPVKSRRGQLVKAAALIVAEIERLDRASV